MTLTRYSHYEVYYTEGADYDILDLSGGVSEDGLARSQFKNRMPLDYTVEYAVALGNTSSETRVAGGYQTSQSQPASILYKNLSGGSTMYAIIKPWGIAPILLAIRGTMEDAKDVLDVHPHSILTQNIFEIRQPHCYRLIWHDHEYFYRGAGMPFKSGSLMPTKGGLTCLQNS